MVGKYFCSLFSSKRDALLQSRDQGVIQNMKRYYRRDFLLNLVKHEGTVKEFQRPYANKDAVFNIACA